MLNERREFEEYHPTTEDGNIVPPCTERMSYRELITNSLGGYPRQLEIVARYFLYEGLKKIKVDNFDIRLEMVETILRLWNYTPTSRDQQAKTEIEKDIEAFLLALFPSIRQALNRYITDHFLAQCKIARDDYASVIMDKEACLADRMDMLQQYKAYINKLPAEEKKKLAADYNKVSNCLKALKSANYNRNKPLSFSANTSAGTTDNNNNKNSFYEFTYQSVIANACAQGKLKKYYLLCKKGEDFGENFNREKDTIKQFEKLTMAKDGKNILGHTKEKAYMDFILKLTAAYLLEKKKKEGYGVYFEESSAADAASVSTDSQSHILAPEYVTLKMTDVFNWCIEVKRMERVADGDSSKFLYDKKPLFTKKKANHNITTIALNPKWLADCGWYIIDEGELIDLIKLRDKSGVNVEDAFMYFIEGLKEYYVVYSDEGSTVPLRRM